MISSMPLVVTTLMASPFHRNARARFASPTTWGRLVPASAKGADVMISPVNGDHARTTKVPPKRALASTRYRPPSMATRP